MNPSSPILSLGRCQRREVRQPTNRIAEESRRHWVSGDDCSLLNLIETEMRTRSDIEAAEQGRNIGHFHTDLNRTKESVTGSSNRTGDWKKVSVNGAPL